MIAAIAGLLMSRTGLGAGLAKVAVYAALLFMVAGAVWGVYEYVKHKGAEEVRDQIREENQDAIREGVEASRSFDSCVAAGGVWDFRRQRCSSSSAGDR